MDQVVESLPHKCKTLSWNHSTTKKKKKYTELEQMGLRVSSGLESIPSMHEALGLIPLYRQINIIGEDWIND
jgi:hypothetical protein